MDSSFDYVFGITVSYGAVSLPENIWNVNRIVLKWACGARRVKDSSALFLAYFTKVGLCGHRAFCVSVYPHINFWMPEPIFMKLGMYIMAPEPILAAYFINPSYQFSLWVCIHIYPL
jgi:hypothetical protein